MRTSATRLAVACCLAAAVAGCSSPPAPAADPAPSAIQVTPGPPPPVGATGAPVAGVTELPPVTVGAEAPFGGGLVAKVVTIAPVQLQASGPGEIAGPGAAVTVSLTNGTKEPVDLTGIAVNASYGKDTPAPPSSSPPSVNVKGMLAVGAQQQGVYTFLVPAADLPTLAVQINYSGSPNVIVVRR